MAGDVMARIILGKWEAQEGKMKQLHEELMRYINTLESNFHKQQEVFLLAGKDETIPYLFFTLIVLPSEPISDYLERSGYAKVQEQCLSMGILSRPVVDRYLQPFTGFLYRPENLSPQSFAVLAELQYKPGKRAHGEPFWTGIANFAEAKEAGTYTYLWSRDMEYEDVLWSFERYVSEGYLWETHVAGELVQQNFKDQKDLRLDTKFSFLRTDLCLV